MTIPLGSTWLFLQKSKHTRPDNMCFAYMSTCFDNYYLLQGIRYIHLTNFASVKIARYLFILYLLRVFVLLISMLVKVQTRKTWVKNKSLNIREIAFIFERHTWMFEQKNVRNSTFAHCPRKCFDRDIIRTCPQMVIMSFWEEERRKKISACCTSFYVHCTCVTCDGEPSLSIWHAKLTSNLKSRRGGVGVAPLA